MSWYDHLKQEQFFIQQEEEHNKFYITSIDEKTFTATVRWGRLGVKGQNQVKNFNSMYDAGRFIDGKISEKTRKGYRKIDKAKFDKLCVEAAIVGTQNKCNNLQWIEFVGDSLKFKPVTEDRLQSPECNPGIRVDVETKKAYGEQTSFRLLFTFDKAYDLRNGEPTLITKSSPIYELTQKVEEAVGRSLS